MNSIRDKRWAVAVTTVPSRLELLLPQTLHSLKRAGFPDPRLFVDGIKDIQWCGLEVTCRKPAVGVYPNWYLTLHELVVRDPAAHYYAIFQDDCVCCANLRAYLDSCQYPNKGYWNLLTFKENVDALAKVRSDKVVGNGWHEARAKWKGLGAVGLVFDRKAAVELLASRMMLMKHFSGPAGSQRKADGAIVEAMNAVGFKEYVHNPSLIQHMGQASTIGNNYGEVGVGFPGEDNEVKV